MAVGFATLSLLDSTSTKQGVGSGIAILGSILNDAYRSGTATAARSLPPDLVEPVQHSLGFTLQLAERGGDRLGCPWL